MTKPKDSIEFVEALVDAGRFEAVEDNDDKLDQCAHAICLAATAENIARIPDIWRDQIMYGNCTLCDDRVIYRSNIPAQAKIVCLQCGMELLGDDDDPHIITRQSGVDELKGYIRKKEEN